MSEADSGGDPFLVPRDPREAAADALMREYLLAAATPEMVCRQDGSGYALIVPQRSGARLLTVPGANEADFMFHGNPGTDGQRLADFVLAALSDSNADHLRLPLLSRAQALHLKACLAGRLPDWLWDVALSATSPLIVGKAPHASLRKALVRAEKAELLIGLTSCFDLHELQDLHCKRWGPHNRTANFFGMLGALLNAGCAEMITARASDGALVAVQFDIMGTAMRHDYYAVSDTLRASRSGTAVLAASWCRFCESISQTVYSFGRGSERYKYLYANRHRALFELRGFFAPA